MRRTVARRPSAARCRAAGRFATAGFGYGYSYGQALRTGFPFLRLDHVLVGAGIGVAASYVGAASASEHLPVIADLLLSPAAGS